MFPEGFGNLKLVNIACGESFPETTFYNKKKFFSFSLEVLRLPQKYKTEINLIVYCIFVEFVRATELATGIHKNETSTRSSQLAKSVNLLTLSFHT